MRYLLDTHTLIWFDHDQNQLSDTVKKICSDTTNTLYISVVSVWEIQIKVTLKKLELPLELQTMIHNQTQSNTLQLLPLDLSHIYQTDILPFHHRDPFDRLLIAQALEENLTFLTKDANITRYSVSVAWE